MIIYENLLNFNGYECVAGKKELEALYINSPILENLSETFAEKVVEYISLRIVNEEEKITSELNNWLSYLINYQEPLLDKVSTLVDEQVIDEEKLKDLIKDLIYRGETKSEVALGLVLCGDYLEDYEIEHIVYVFSKSGEYVFYLSDYIKNIEDSEEFLFDLCKKTEGTIRVFAIMNMDFSKEEEIKYLINEGFKNKEYTSFLIKYIIDKEYLWNYLKRDDLNFRDIKNISYMIVNSIKKEDVQNIPYLMNLVNLYLPYALIGGSDIYSIYAVYLIDMVMFTKELASLKDKEFLSVIIKDKLKRCEYLFKDALKNVEGDAPCIIELGKYYKYEFLFEDLKPYLRSVKDGYFIYYYFKKYSSSIEREECIKYFKNNHQFKEVLEYYDLENYNEHPGDEESILKFESILNKRSSISS